MYNKQDPNSFTQYLPLYLAQSKIGLLSLEYTVALYNDVLVSTTDSVTQPANQQFVLTCTQRVFLSNVSSSSTAVSPIVVTDSTPEQFENYPALLSAAMVIQGGSGLGLNLLDYSPHTVNTAVQQSQSGSGTNGQSSSVSSTTGTSNSQSSTYGTSVSVSAGFTGDIPMGSVTSTHDHSTTNTTSSDQSNSSGADTSSSYQTSASASMSIKDWGSYAVIDPGSSCPIWYFGQEYPWNAIECRFAKSGVYNQLNNNQIEMYVSSTMQAQLYDGSFLYPPSELSYFGLNFVMKSQWRVYVDYDTSTSIAITNPVDYYSASHLLNDTGQTDSNGDEIYSPQVFMDANASALTMLDSNGNYVTPSITIDLNTMGLDAIGHNTNTAIIGFLPNKFIPPVAATSDASTTLPTSFKIISSTNDLMVLGTSATTGVFSTSDTCITANWPAQTTASCEMTLYFKILDSVNEYSLFIKHWKTEATGVELSFVFNGNSNNPVTKYVDALEGEGGESNLLRLALRDLDFSSIEYHDYLQLGLNAVTVTMTPMNANGCGYQIRALSVQKS
jgi:hypothetical protein